MCMNIDVSIIIPVYNMEKYIEECLDSVFNQTYKNIEVIIINDGSTDNSKDIIKKFILKYKNIIYIEQLNQGLSMARNNALDYVNGEYVLFLDSDDYLEKDCIELIYKKAKEKDCDMVIMGHRKVYDDKLYHKDEYCINNLDENKLYSGKYVANMMLENKIQGYCCDKLIKMELIKKNNLYFEPNKYIEDLYPIFKLVHNCKKVNFVNKPLYNYRQLESSSSHKRTEKLIKDYAYANVNVLEYIKDKDDFNEDNILNFQYEAFRTLIFMINEYHNKSYKIYSEFNKSILKSYEPDIKRVYKCKCIRLRRKIDITLWKLKIYNLFMPELRKLKIYMESIVLKQRSVALNIMSEKKIFDIS